MKNLKTNYRALLGLLFIFTVLFNSIVGARAEINPYGVSKPAVLVKGKVPILLYHDINTNPDKSGIAVTPEKFESDLAALKQAGYTAMNFKDLVDCIDKVKPWPSKPVIITFDDGYASNYTYAYPLLKKYEMRACFFVIGWSVGRTNQESSVEGITPHFTWQEAREMAESGLVEIQNHTYDLHSEEGLSYGKGEATGKGVSKLSLEPAYNYQYRLISDFKYNNELIQKATGQSPTILAYPMGIRNFESDFTVQDAGLLGAVTTEKAVRVYLTRLDLRAMPRLNITMAIRSQNLVKYIENQPLK